MYNHVSFQGQTLIGFTEHTTSSLTVDPADLFVIAAPPFGWLSLYSSSCGFGSHPNSRAAWQALKTTFLLPDTASSHSGKTQTYCAHIAI